METQPTEVYIIPDEDSTFSFFISSILYALFAEPQLIHLQ